MGGAAIGSAHAPHLPFDLWPMRFPLTRLASHAGTGKVVSFLRRSPSQMVRVTGDRSCRWKEKRKKVLSDEREDGRMRLNNNNAAWDEDSPQMVD